MVLICREMHWTFEQYLQQPDWFVDMIIETKNLEEFYASRKRKNRK